MMPELPRNYVLVGRKNVEAYLVYISRILPDFEVVVHAKGNDQIVNAMDLVVQAMKALNLKAVKGTITFPMGSTRIVPTLSVTLMREKDEAGKSRVFA